MKTLQKIHLPKNKFLAALFVVASCFLVVILLSFLVRPALTAYYSFFREGVRNGDFIDGIESGGNSLIFAAKCEAWGGEAIPSSFAMACGVKAPDAGKTCRFDEDCKYYCLYPSQPEDPGSFGFSRQPKPGETGRCSNLMNGANQFGCHRPKDMKDGAINCLGGPAS